MRATTDASEQGLPVRLRNIRCNDLDETHALTDRRTHRQERNQPQTAHSIPVGTLAQIPSMVWGCPVDEGDVGARQQEPGTGARISDDDCSGLARRRRGVGGSGHHRL